MIRFMAKYFQRVLESDLNFFDSSKNRCGKYVIDKNLFFLSLIKKSNKNRWFFQNYSCLLIKTV